MDSLRVLFVDDDDQIRLVLGKLLRRRGDNYTLAASGPEALEILAQDDFDVLVTDLSMPEMDGLEVVSRARTISPRTVAIVLTGVGTRDDVKMAMREGVFDFVDKPISSLATFSMLIGRAGKQSRLVRERDQLLEDTRRQNAELSRLVGERDKLVEESKQKNLKMKESLAQLHDAYERLKRQGRILEFDMEQARRLHERFLPTSFPRVEGLDVFAYYRPCERLGGDFFGVIPISSTKVAIYLADVAGHGISAAMITILIHELIRAHRRYDSIEPVFHHPHQALETINIGLLKEEFDPLILVTMVYAVIDTQKGEVVAGCAGHPPPVLVKANGTASLIPATGPVMGVSTHVPFIPARFRLEPGDYCLLYSDGLSEASDKEGRQMGETQLARLAVQAVGLEAHLAGSAIETAIKVYQNGAAPQDDLTFLVIRRRADGEDTEKENARHSVWIDRAPLRPPANYNLPPVSPKPDPAKPKSLNV